MALPTIYIRVGTVIEPRSPQGDITGPDTDPRAGLARHAPGLYRFLTRRLRRRVEVDDLVQYVYLRFLQSPQHELVRNIESYLYRIAANVVNEFALHKRREIVTYDSETADAAGERRSETDIWQDDLTEKFATEQQLERVLAQVPATYRAVLAFWLWEDMSQEDIARRLGLSPQSVKKYIARGLAYCRQANWNP